MEAEKNKEVKLNKKGSPKREPKHFKAISQWRNMVLRHKDLTASERIYLTTLAKRINAHNLAWPSHATVCEACNISRSTAQRALRRAQELGLLECEAHFRENGRQTSNNYRLIFPQTIENPFDPPPDVTSQESEEPPRTTEDAAQAK